MEIMYLFFLCGAFLIGSVFCISRSVLPIKQAWQESNQKKTTNHVAILWLGIMLGALFLKILEVVLRRFSITEGGIANPILFVFFNLLISFIAFLGISRSVISIKQAWKENNQKKMKRNVSFFSIGVMASFVLIKMVIKSC